jgi:hypothetical protein
MRRLRRPVTSSMVAAILVGTALGAAAHAASIAAPYQNCTQLNTRYPHGVGLLEARDRAPSGAPVTTFMRNDKLYALAMSYNKALDSDHDGIACEKS